MTTNKPTHFFIGKRKILLINEMKQKLQRLIRKRGKMASQPKQTKISMRLVPRPKIIICHSLPKEGKVLARDQSERKHN